MKRSKPSPVKPAEHIPLYSTNDAAFHAASSGLEKAQALVGLGQLRLALQALYDGGIKQPERRLFQALAYVLSGERLGFEGGCCIAPDGKKHYTLGIDPPINPEAWHGPN